MFEGDERWRGLPVPDGHQFEWDPSSTYVRNPPFFDGIELAPVPLRDLHGARVLAVLGDSVTTDHISPAGSIPADSPAGKYLIAQGVEPRDFNSYGARRGNHEVMMRGTFANIRLRNQLAPGTEGRMDDPPARGRADGDLRRRYALRRARRVLFSCWPVRSTDRDPHATGRQRGTRLLGVRTVIAESFERIHRSNLVNMGVLPLQFKARDGVTSLELTGREAFELTGIAEGLRPGGDVKVRARASDGATREFVATARIETPEELTSFRHGGILPYVLRQLVWS